MIAALYVYRDGVYAGLSDVDLWDQERDARKYPGPHSVVAHPPCGRWCQLSHINQARWGAMVGDDGGCFKSALANVQKWGGVLEHPARSYAWPRFGLAAPRGNGWQRCMFGNNDGMRSWVCEVSQAAYGHPARKLTWLYYVGHAPPPPMDWSRPAPSAVVSACRNHGDSPLPRVMKRAASETPIAFRDVLLSLAASARRKERAA